MKKQKILLVLGTFLILACPAAGAENSAIRCLEIKFADGTVQHGTGFFVGPSLFLTANHVLKNEEKNIVAIKTNLGEEGLVSTAIPKRDFALLKIKRAPPKPYFFRLADSGSVKQDDEVTIIGCKDKNIILEISGRIFSKPPASQTLNQAKFILIEAGISFGFSGAPVINKDGEVIAMAISILLLENNGRRKVFVLAAEIDWAEKIAAMLELEEP